MPPIEYVRQLMDQIEREYDNINLDEMYNRQPIETSPSDRIYITACAMYGMIKSGESVIYEDKCSRHFLFTFSNTLQAPIILASGLGSHHTPKFSFLKA